MKNISKKNFEDLMDASNKYHYAEKVQNLKNKDGEWDVNFEIRTKYIQNLNQKYKQDGSYVYNQEVKKLKRKKYPKDIEEKIIKEFQNAYLVEFYENKKNNNDAQEQKPESEYFQNLKQVRPYLSEISNHIFDWTYSDFSKEDLESIGKEINSLSSEIQKLIIKLGGFRYFTSPSEEIIIYAIETHNISLDLLKPEQRTKKIDIIAAKNGFIFNIKEIKNISKEAKLIFIENNPDKIITKITAENYNTKNLTIYDLNKKELEAYNKGIETYNKKQEQKQIELVKQDYKNIEKISNPSTVVRNIAINEFRKRWER